MLTGKVEEFPNGWALTEISSVCIVNPTIDKSAFSDDLEISFVPMSAVQPESGVIDVTDSRKFAEVKKGYTPFSEGDVLFAKITPCMENGKMAVVPPLRNGLGFGSTEFHVLRAHLGINSAYLYYYVSSGSFRREAEHNMSGAVGQRRVTTSYLSACKLPIPPTNEQHRIVAKIEELFSELDKGIESLKTAQAQLKVYRQALLKHAFEGKLTAQWRADHPDQLESADVLLNRIRLERAQRYRQQLADWEAAGKQGSKPKVPKPLLPLNSEELTELPELPKGWKWVKLGEVLKTTVGFAFKSKEFAHEGIRLLRGENIEPRQLRWTDTRFWPKAHLTEFESFLVSAGEIIIAMDRPVISSGLKVARVKPTDAPCLLVQRVTRVKEQPSIFTGYALFVIDQNRFVNHCLGNQTGTQLPHISEAQIRSYPLPLCSFQEQKQVFEALDAKISEVDQLDQTITTSLQQAETLRQSILKKAFSGQLVPQDPHDEPASVLLARIKAARESATQKPAATGRRTRKAAV